MRLIDSKLLPVTCLEWLPLPFWSFTLNWGKWFYPWTIEWPVLFPLLCWSGCIGWKLWYPPWLLPRSLTPPNWFVGLVNYPRGPWCEPKAIWAPLEPPPLLSSCKPSLPWIECPPTKEVGLFKLLWWFPDPSLKWWPCPPELLTPWSLRFSDPAFLELPCALPTMTDGGEGLLTLPSYWCCYNCW